MTCKKISEFSSKLGTDEDWIYIGDFLDYFYSNPSADSLDEPVWTNQSDYTKSFISAMAAQLAFNYGFKIPKWTKDEKYILKEPHFAMNAKGNLRLVLLAESPKFFRDRNIYTTDNVLGRV